MRVGGISAVVNSVNSAGTSIEFTMPVGTGTDKVVQVQIGAAGAGTGNTCVGTPSDTGGDYLLSVGCACASIGTNSSYPFELHDCAPNPEPLQSFVSHTNAVKVTPGSFHIR